MFYGRQSELNSMNKRYAGEKFECIVMYGRRRVGKTSLIKEFCKDKPVIFFSALNASSGENLDALSKAVFEYKTPDNLSYPKFHSYEDVLEEISKMAQEQRLVFVIDEYPYLAKAEPSISSRFQHIIDHVWQNGRLYLILCGSSMSFMQNQVLGYESPLYGRRTAQFKIEALTYRDITVFNPDLSLADQALIYGITGGIPHYINKLDVNQDVDEALQENLFDTSSYLFEEPENLLKQELREPAIYNSIISAVAGGASRANEISTKVGIESGICAKYLRVLLDLGILQKETPVGEKVGKRTIYRVGDNFFRFWYAFGFTNFSQLEDGDADGVYEYVIAPALHEFASFAFEDVCREFVKELQKKNALPFRYSRMGRWTGKTTVRDKDAAGGLRTAETEIDLLGIGSDAKEYLVGECKFKNTPFNYSEYLAVKTKLTSLKDTSKLYYALFSESGFDDKITAEAEDKSNLLLYSLEQIVNLS